MTSIDINRIAQIFESVKGDTDRKDKVKKRDIVVLPIIPSLNKKIGVFKKEKQSQVEHNTGDQQ